MKELKVGQRVKSVIGDRCGIVKGVHPVTQSATVWFLGDNRNELKPQRSLLPISKIEYQTAELACLRADTTKTAARYDEILALRMLLLDVVDFLKEEDHPRFTRVQQRIERQADGWGKEGDCV